MSTMNLVYISAMMKYHINSNSNSHSFIVLRSICTFLYFLCELETFNRFNFLPNKSFTQPMQTKFGYCCCCCWCRSHCSTYFFIEYWELLRNCILSSNHFNIFYFSNWRQPTLTAWDVNASYASFYSTMRCISLCKQKQPKPYIFFFSGETPKAATNWNWQNGKSFGFLFLLRLDICLCSILYVCVCECEIVLWYFSISLPFCFVFFRWFFVAMRQPHHRIKLSADTHTCSNSQTITWMWYNFKAAKQWQCIQRTFEMSEMKLFA